MNLLKRQMRLSSESPISAYEEIIYDQAAPLIWETVNGIKDFASPDEHSVAELISMLNSKTSH